MKKIPTLFQKNPSDLGRVIPEINPASAWIFEGTPFEVFRKMDGSACAIIGGEFFKRYDAKLFKRKRGKIVKRWTPEEVKAKLPEGAIPCQDPDEVSGHWPHWIPVDPEDPADRWFLQALRNTNVPLIFPDPENERTVFSFEAVGPHFNGNKGGHDRDFVVWHKDPKIRLDRSKIDYWINKEKIRDFKAILSMCEFEGLVFHEIGGDRMAKIRRSDFGLPWPIK